MDFGPCGRSHISRLHKLQSLEASVPIVFTSVGKFRGHQPLSQLERVAGSEKGEALRANSGTTTSVGSNRYCEHRPFLTSTHADIQHRAMTTATTEPSRPRLPTTGQTCTTYARKDSRDDMTTPRGHAFGCRLTRRAVPREKGCHYNMQGNSGEKHPIRAENTWQ